jgi:hypothetical protein
MLRMMRGRQVLEVGVEGDGGDGDHQPGRRRPEGLADVLGQHRRLRGALFGEARVMKA